MAALATHYEVNSDFTQYRFYLRGHSRPRGIKLPNTDTLHQEYISGVLSQDFSRGRKAPPDSVPARWSDGSTVTAHDFVYSWRRLLDPRTARPQYSFLLFYVNNAQEIGAGKLASDRLGAQAIDDFTLQVSLRAPVTFFLQLTSKCPLAAAPRQAIEAASFLGAEDSWTHPARIVTSGAFTLGEHKPYDRIVMVRNPRYYESGVVALDEITFLPVTDANTTLNLYRSGEAHAMSGDRMPPLFTAAVQRKKDAYTAPAFYHICPVFNTTKQPFKNALVRYALNMAIDKREMAGVFGEGCRPAKTFVPPFDGYQPPVSVEVPVDGKNVDVLAYNPAAARELLAKAGFQNGMVRGGRRLSFELRVPQIPFGVPVAEILQQQWRGNLGIEPRLQTQELSAYITATVTGQFEMALNGGSGDYMDPNVYLNLFQTGRDYAPAWSDPVYDAMLDAANRNVNPASRLNQLARCESYLLRAMPLAPMMFYGYAGFLKPYVRNISTNLLDHHPLKYVWIDTNWRPA
jgi:ABC-type oligopeptide transport system substrate-binding subunit